MKKLIISISLFAIVGLMMFVSAATFVLAGSQSVQSNTQPLWITYEPRLAQTNAYYCEPSMDRIVSAYHEPPFGTMTVLDHAINDEKFKFVATDSTGADRRLLPYSDDNQAGLGRTDILVTKIMDMPDGFSIYNDTLKFSQIPGLGYSSTTTIGMGRIIYRFKDYYGDTWSSWSNRALVDGQTFNFTTVQPKNFQFIVMYEVKEFALHFWQPHKYYHVLGQYDFVISPYIF